MTARKPIKDRIDYQGGELDEIVVSGSAHLERLDDRTWFLSMTRDDGTDYVMFFHSKNLHKAEVEVREPVSKRGKR